MPGGYCLSDLTFLKLEYCADAKPETKSDSMLVWAAHYDPEIDKRSMLLNCQIQLLLCAC